MGKASRRLTIAAKPISNPWEAVPTLHRRSNCTLEVVSLDEVKLSLNTAFCRRLVNENTEALTIRVNVLEQTLGLIPLRDGDPRIKDETFLQTNNVVSFAANRRGDCNDKRISISALLQLYPWLRVQAQAPAAADRRRFPIWNDRFGLYVLAKSNQA